MAGALVTAVQYLLGHSSPQTTLKVYSHWFANTQSDSVMVPPGHWPEILDIFYTSGRSEGSAEIGEGAQVLNFTKELMVPPAGFEPTAPGLGIPRKG